MKKEDLRIVYMGTPDFAVESLRALVEGGYNVVGVITMPDKPMGRHGSVLQPSAVKQYAVSVGLPVLQPEKLKDEAFLEELRALRADLQIVVAFRMLPEVVWNMPRLGTFNLHASLLPQYRGAAPINWAVINGDTETGVTTFFLTHEIDTGKIIRQKHLPIADTDDVETVHDALMAMGAGLVTVGILTSLGDVGEADPTMWAAFAALFAGSVPAILAFCAFNLLCAPCFAAIGTIWREMGTAKWTWFTIGYMTIFAWCVGLMFYQFGGLLTGEIGFNVWTVVAIVVLAGMLFQIFRPMPTFDKKKDKVAGELEAEGSVA